MVRWPSRATGGTRTSTNTIYADNAFLPSSIATQFGTLSNGYNALTGVSGAATQPTQTLTVGTINTNNLDLSKPMDLTAVCNTVGVPCLKLNRTLTRGVFTLEGTLGGDWSWQAYAQHSQMRERQTAAQDSFTPALQLCDRRDQGDGGQSGRERPADRQHPVPRACSGRPERRRLRAAEYLRQ